MRKIKKLLLILLTSILFGTVIGSNISLAVDPNVILEVRRYRTNGYEYHILADPVYSKTVEKIVRTGGTEPQDNPSALYYCLQAGVGFGNGDPQANTNPVTYTSDGDYVNLISSDPNVLSTERSNLIYLLDNLYTKIGSGSKDEIVDFIFGLLGGKYSKSEISSIVKNSADPIDNDDIDAIQQLAIWHYTNPVTSSTDPDKSYNLYYQENSELNHFTYLDLVPQSGTDKEYAYREGEGDKMEILHDLFGALIEDANANGNDYLNNRKTTVTQPAKKTGLLKLAESYYVSEMTDATSIYVDKDSTFKSISFKDQNGNTIDNSKILVYINDPQYNNNQHLVLANQLAAYDISDKKLGFGIYMANTSNISKINVELKVDVKLAPKLTHYPGDSTTQPIVKIEPNVGEKVYTAEYTIERKFDLALRKYITKINGTAVSAAETRVPNIESGNINKTEGGTLITTADYKHRKDPKVVKHGDTVTYKITIYNEGQIDGYATQIVDQLPRYLTIETAALNAISQNSNYEVESYNTTTNVLTLRRKAGVTDTLSAFITEGNLDSEDIEITCKVNDTSDGQNDKILTNIAWISGHSYSGIDRDSQPSTTPNVNQDSSSYNSSGITDLSNPNTYYHGEQDDDDFEKIKILKRGSTEYSINIQKVNSKGSVINKLSKFKLLLGNNEEREITGFGELGKIIADSTGDSEYYIQETMAPGGQTNPTTDPDRYNRILNNIKITVHKELDPTSNEYRITQITIDQEGVTSEVTGTNVNLTIINKQFDLALRKFIVKIGDDDVTDREPAITAAETTALAGKTATFDDGNTAKKTHTKDPKKVKNGQIVKYKIRVYNEGEIAGKATKVTDYLPAGLELANTALNTTYGWQKESGNDRIVYTNYLADRVIQPATSSAINYEDLEIECVVTAEQPENEDISLKNIAAITEAKDENNNEVTDRDSNPTALTEDERNTYNPEHATEGKGIQDDDDYEELILQPEYFDLALRKYIVGVYKNLEDLNNNHSISFDSRTPNIDVSTIKTAEKTATYKHKKDPIIVEEGYYVTYAITIYNEGTQSGYPTKIVDQLPVGLTYHSLATNTLYEKDDAASVENKVVFNRTSTEPLLPYSNTLVFDPTNYETLLVTCKVEASADTANNKILTNVAWIAEEKNTETGVVIQDQVGLDRDSEPYTVPTVTQDTLPNYSGTSNKNGDLTDPTHFYKGQQDDDDFEKIVLLPEAFDLKLIKKITEVNGEAVDERLTDIDVSKLNTLGTDGNIISTADYTFVDKVQNPVYVKKGDIVTYTFRVYNEGMKDGYAARITEDIPAGLQFLTSTKTIAEIQADDDIPEAEKAAIIYNKQHGWVADTNNANLVSTEYLSKENEATAGANLIEAFGSHDNSKTKAYLESRAKEISIKLKVVSDDTTGKTIRNEAAITKYEDANGNEITEDRDSESNHWVKYQDDEDFDLIKLSQFDLALHKFISQIDDKPVTKRELEEPNTEGLKNKTAETAEYHFTKEPILVANGQTVIYTIRVYNEGEIDGYASLIKDDIPEGLEYIPDHDINIEYGWQMLKSNGEKTTDVKLAKAISTDYLSKEQEEERAKLKSKLTNDSDAELKDAIIRAYDPKEDKLYYRDVKVAFKVGAKVTEGRIITNEAQISGNTDSEGNTVTDRDSEPDVWNEEDDEDIEKIKVQIFDLSLRKWITEVTVDDGSSVTTTETGHKAEDEPESIVKVEIKDKKIKTVVVKFKFKIRVTNEGTIPGYVKEIKDYIPEGLEFVQEDNPNWGPSKDNDGTYVTREAENVLLQPGESTEVEIILRWKNGNDNLGLKENYAEISEDYNEYGAPDCDSVPNNNDRKNDDDIDYAPVLLSVKTGQLRIYFTIIGGFLVLVLAGVTFIKKFVI